VNNFIFDNWSGINFIRIVNTFARNGAIMGRSYLRRSSVAYATETADGGLRPPQPVMSPKQPMVAKNATTLAAGPTGVLRESRLG